MMMVMLKEVHSIAAGLDYPGVGPEHVYLESIKRVKYVAVTNEDAIEAFKYLSKTEGIILQLNRLCCSLCDKTR